MILAKKRTLEAYEELRDKFEKDAELIGKRFNNVVKEQRKKFILDEEKMKRQAEDNKTCKEKNDKDKSQAKDNKNYSEKNDKAPIWIDNVFY